MKPLIILFLIVFSGSNSFGQLKRHGISNEKNDLETGKAVGPDFKLLSNNQFDSLGNRVITFQNKKNTLIQKKFYFRQENGLCFKSEDVLPLELLPSKISQLNKKHKPTEPGKWDDQDSSLITITVNYVMGQNFFTVSYTNTLDDL